MSTVYEVGMRVRIRPARPFAGREGVVRAVDPARLTVYILPNGPEIHSLVHDVEILTSAPAKSIP